MSELEYVYVSGEVPALGALLPELLGLSTVFENEHEIQVLGPTPGAEGSTTELWVEPAEPETEPADATTGYAAEIAVRVYGDVTAQADEARRVFELLRTARPDWPLLLTHEAVTVLAAYRPGAGVHEFAPPVGVDATDAAAWRPWVADATRATGDENG